ILHVVQRMTLLAGTFTLLGLVTYSRYIVNHRFDYNKPFTFQILSLACIGFLGILSKETAILLPLFIFSLNYTLFQKELSHTKQKANYWQLALLLGPLIFIVLIYLLNSAQYAISWEKRGFSLYERLLTEARILLEYFHRIFLPKAGGMGLFHDNYQVSRGLFSPISTFFSIIALVLLLTFALISRHRRPFLSLAILFFLLGHTLESTILPLELYFEHRNYLPSLCLIFIVIQCAIELKDKNSKVKTFLFTPYLVLTAFVTMTSAFVWGDKLKLYTNWALENPTSMRAQHKAADTWLIDYNSPVEARRFLIQALLSDPESTGTRIKLIQMQCYFNTPPDDIKSLASGLDSSDIDLIYSSSLSEIVSLKEIDKCNTLSTATLIRIVSDLERNPDIRKTSGLQWLYFHKAKLLHLNNELEAALKYANMSSELGAFIATSILKLELAIKLNDSDLKREYVNEAKSLETTQLKFISKELTEKYKVLKNNIHSGE
ncbi:MAG: hypothetical protein OQJ89_14070, partial [Kangiellaceae bacterium]|nr:hypothetical protein [Kangiellaceae bacterium]